MCKIRLDDVSTNDILVADGGFDCIPEGAECVVKTAKCCGSKYISCDDGEHFLDGQIDDDGILVGLKKRLTGVQE